MHGGGEERRGQRGRREDEDEEETGREASLSPLLPAPAGGGALAGPPPGGPRRRGARGERPRPRGEAKGHLRRPCAPRGARRDGQCVWLCAGGGGGGGRGRGGVADARAPRQASAPSAGAAARLLYWKMFARRPAPPLRFWLPRPPIGGPTQLTEAFGPRCGR
ncbi:unnamed protein product [Prorocentrum cordatum]|uniref:Uncharacterized protein n=1 Tax=Prorocentrum cordatum TaxID=2364126 RepID=A0ABN9PA44_9DINO|nr:unnamed protein product [Polarella glacialis]